MTYRSTRSSTRSTPALRTVDVAGIEWPKYKLEALALGVIAFAAALVLAGSLQAAVLGGAAITLGAWWTLRLAELHLAEPTSPGQAARTK